MANITRRVDKRLRKRGVLVEGERVEVAVLVEPKGTYGSGMLRLAAAPRSTMRKLERDAADDRGETAGAAADFPAASSVVAVTGTRILVVRSNGLTFGDVELDLPRGRVLVGEIESSGIGRRMTLVFADGSSVQVDLHRAQPVRELGEALGRAN